METRQKEISARAERPGSETLPKLAPFGRSAQTGRRRAGNPAALHPIHLEQLDWYSVFDLAPEQALASKRRLVERATAEKALVQAFHFPFPGLGHVVQREEGWQWQPIERTK